MSPSPLYKRYTSSKYLITITLSVLILLISMPIVAVMTLTHADSIDAANSVNGITSYTGDLYDWGNCTWWASMRRSQIGEPIPNTWGNATTWAPRAQNDGYLVDHNPSYGAIMQISNVDFGLGHVAFVESVSADGSWAISEMNVKGLDVVDYKTLNLGAASRFNFIHEKVL